VAIVSSDPSTHVKRIRMLEKLGATSVRVMSVSGAEALGTLRIYVEQVPPELRALDAEPQQAGATAGRRTRSPRRR